MRRDIMKGVNSVWIFDHDREVVYVNDIYEIVENRHYWRLNVRCLN